MINYNENMYNELFNNKYITKTSDNELLNDKL